MFNYNTDRYTREQKDLLSDILMDFVTDGLADYIDDYEDEEEDEIEEPMRDYTYEDYMADAMHYLDKAYEYLGSLKKIPRAESVQPRYDYQNSKPAKKQEPVEKPRYSYKTFTTNPQIKPDYYEKSKHCGCSYKPAGTCACKTSGSDGHCTCKSKSTIPSVSVPKITRVIFNNPDTTVFFSDGTISHVKTVKGDTFDKEHGILYAVFKRLYGNHGNREGMYGLMPGNGASILLQRLVNGADDIKKKKVVSKQKPDAPIETPNDKEAPSPSAYYSV